MSAEQVEVVVVGAGQAGIAMSQHLSERGVSHIVLEKERIAERWRTGRWDSLVANGPACVASSRNFRRRLSTFRRSEISS